MSVNSAKKPLAGDVLDQTTAELRLAVDDEIYNGGQGPRFSVSPGAEPFARKASDRLGGPAREWLSIVAAIAAAGGCLLVLPREMWGSVWALLPMFATSLAVNALLTWWLGRGLWVPMFKVSLVLTRRFLDACQCADPRVRVHLDRMRPGFFDLLAELELAEKAARNAGADSQQAVVRDALLVTAVDVTAFAVTASVAGVVPAGRVSLVHPDRCDLNNLRLTEAMLFLARPRER